MAEPKRYEVYADYLQCVVVTIEAASEDEAIELARQLPQRLDPQGWQMLSGWPVIRPFMVRKKTDK